MRPFFKAVAVLVVLAASSSFAEPPQGEVVIRTRKGGLVMGRILSETSKGYLVSGPDGTSVVEFAAISDIRQLAPTKPVVDAPLPPPAPPQVVAAPVVEAAPVATAAEAPPRPPERPSEPSVEEVIKSRAERPNGKREGFHFGLGLGAMLLPAGPMAQLEAHFEFNFGRPAYRATLNGGVLTSYFYILGSVSIDNLFQFHVGDVYAFGAGLKLGAAFGAGAYVYAAPILQPVVITLGHRGQHQLSLTASLVVLSSISARYDWSTRTDSEGSLAGTLQTYLGYTYLF